MSGLSASIVGLISLHCISKVKSQYGSNLPILCHCFGLPANLSLSLVSFSPVDVSVDKFPFSLQYKPKTLTPKWLERFDLYMYEDQTSYLELVVWDHDHSGRDDMMGR